MSTKPGRAPPLLPKHMAARPDAQAFAPDFIVAFVLFFVGLLIGIKLIINIFSNETFTELSDDAASISDLLLTEGYPSNWTDTTVLRPGLLSAGLLDPGKILEFSKLPYTPSLTLLDTRYHYAVSFSDANGRPLAIAGVCGLGHPAYIENATNRTAAYFSDDPGEADYALAEPLLRELQADLYHRQDLPGGTFLTYNLTGGLSLLLNDVARYTLVVMEDPNLNAWKGSHTLLNVTDTLEAWTRRGGTLVLTGHVNGNASFLAAWPPTPTAAQAPATFVGNASLFPFPLGENFTPEQPQPASLSYNLSSTAVLAQFADGQPAILSWNVGLGTVLYVTDVRHANGSNASALLLPGLRRLAANCSAPFFEKSGTSNLARFERVVTYHSSLIRMAVATWEAPP